MTRPDGGRRVLRAAAVQLEARPGDRDANLRRMVELVRRIEEPVDLIVAPELASTGYDLDLIARRGPDLAEGRDGPTASVAAELADDLGAVIVVGFLEASDGHLYDAALVAATDGSLQVYRKSHLYPPERARFSPGDDLAALPTPAARLGVMICFEHAFPEIATTLALRGAEVLAVPSAVPRGFEHLLELRSRARAQDNQLFLVASNLTGGRFCGGSLIVDPRGEVVTAAGGDEGVLRAALDLNAIDRERRQEPALRLRRPELYEGRG